MYVRLAQAGDAEAAVAVLRRSIKELCIADHQNDPVVLEGWLANKTPENFCRWLDNGNSQIAVAVDNERHVLGVGGYAGDKITLNYVDPDARFSGVSSAIIDWLEARMRADGHSVSHLRSTSTAHQFYLARGYRDDGPEELWRGNAYVQPMVKAI